MASRQWAGGAPTPGLLRCEPLLPSSRWARCRHGDLQGLSFLEEGPLSSGHGPGWRDESQLVGAEGWKHLHWSLHPELTAGAEGRLLTWPPMSWSLILCGKDTVKCFYGISVATNNVMGRTVSSPPNSSVEALTVSTPECDCFWRWDF